MFGDLKTSAEVLLALEKMESSNAACNAKGGKWKISGGNKTDGPQYACLDSKGMLLLLPNAQSTRPADITPVLEEHTTPPPAIISSPTVVREEPLILGMPKKTAMIAGGIGAGLLLLLALK